MSVIVEIEVPVEAFPLGELIERRPEATVELEQLVPADNGVLPFFWVRNVATDVVAETGEVKDAFHSVTVLDDTGEALLCRMIWNDDESGLQDILVNERAALLEARGSADGWQFQLRFTDRTAAHRLRENLSEDDVPFEVVKVYSVQKMPGRQYDLTNEQHKALATIHQAGFFETPRKATLAEIADDLDISPQALSTRYRRGLNSLLSNTLYETD